MVGVVLLAGGSGKRMKADENKAYLPLAGEPLLCHSLRTLSGHKSISGLVLVIRPEDEAKANEAIRRVGCEQQIKAIVNGGVERQHSVQQALAACPDHWQTVLIHDSARPLVSRELIERLCRQVDEKTGVVPVLDLTDTIKKIDEQGFIKETVPREQLVCVQTPQAFPLNLLRHAHAIVQRKDLIITDDAMAFEAAGYRIKTVPGADENMKVTVPGDLPLVEWYLKRKEAAPCE